MSILYVIHMCVEENLGELIFGLVYVRSNTFKRAGDKLLYMQM